MSDIIKSLPEIGREYRLPLTDSEEEVEITAVTIGEWGATVRALIVASRHRTLPGIVIELPLESFWEIVQTA